RRGHCTGIATADFFLRHGARGCVSAAAVADATSLKEDPMTHVNLRKLASLFVLGGSLAAAGLAAGCSSESQPPSAPLPTGQGGGTNPMPTDGAEIRVVHASSDAPAVDVYIETWDTPVIE